jgi:prevent-host-death family protein
MHCVEASRAKQNFGELIARAASGPVGVRRHGRLVAAVVPADWAARLEAVDERRAAREAQKAVEARRLCAHQRIAIELLCASAQQQAKWLQAAHREIDRWEKDRLCSRDYIDRWREWLALPVRKLAKLMCSDADGWGPAMRQNSPFSARAAAG